MMTSLAKTIVSANGFVELEYFGGNILNYLYIRACLVPGFFFPTSVRFRFRHTLF